MSNEPENKPQNPPDGGDEKTVAEMLAEMKSEYEKRISELETKLTAERNSYAKKEYERLMGKEPQEGEPNPLDNDHGSAEGATARSAEAIAERLNKKYKRI